MIDLSRLSPPPIIEELDYEIIVERMLAQLSRLLPEWTADKLESDPAVKILEVAAYRELLLRQRVNEAARACMLAFSLSGDLDNLAGFYGITRLPGANATFGAEIRLARALDMPATIPARWRLRSSIGSPEAELTASVTFPPGETLVTGLFELVHPAGSEGNGIHLTWMPVAPLPFVANVTQQIRSHGGSDPEPDDDFRRRVALSLERYSTAGPRGAYEYWAISADERVIDARAYSPQPGKVTLVLMSEAETGEADEAMLLRVRNIVTDERVRPLTDQVEVKSVKVLPYAIRAHLTIYPGVASAPVYADAEKRLLELTTKLHRIGMDVTKSALIAAAHAPGVKRADIQLPEDIRIGNDETAYCTDLILTAETANEP